MWAGVWADAWADVWADAAPAIGRPNWRSRRCNVRATRCDRASVCTSSSRRNMWRSRRQSSCSSAPRKSAWLCSSCCSAWRSISSTVLCTWATTSRSTGLPSISAMSPYQSPGPSKSSVKGRPSRPLVARPSAPPATPTQSAAAWPRRTSVAPRRTRCTRQRARMAWRSATDRPANQVPVSTPRTSAGRSASKCGGRGAGVGSGAAEPGAGWASRAGVGWASRPGIGWASRPTDAAGLAGTKGR